MGCTPPAIYLHFKDKDELLFATCEREYRALGSAMDEAVAGAGTALDGLRRLARRYVGFALDNPEAYRILLMTRTTMSTIPSLARRLQDISGFDRVVAMAQRCIDEGAIAPRDALLVAGGLWTAVHGIAALLIAKPVFPWGSVDMLIDHCIDVHCRGLTVPRS